MLQCALFFESSSVYASAWPFDSTFFRSIIAALTYFDI